MRTTFYIILFSINLLVASCGNDKAASASKANAAAKTSDIKNGEWIPAFRELRDAIYQQDMNQLKSYFDFPVKNSELYWLATDDDSQDSVITEAEFELHYKKIFSSDLGNSMLHIKSDSLKIFNEHESIWIEPKKEFEFKAWVNYDPITKELSIVLFSHYIGNDTGRYPEGGEFSIHYFFRFNTDNKLKFEKLFMAG